ncbi:hypothetical protein ABIA32_006223 [Streptacidiphilus sp. MAP12-20]|uniref:alpha-L-fucosidase n=1 Tax=Streptacidiphilus sp. MAP12-20 TaxID=3156299 RepID=UPI003515EBD6
MRRSLSGLLAALLVLIGLLTLPTVPASATTVVPQAGVNPIPLDQTSTTDNVQVLLGTLAEHPSDITVADPTEGRKNFYIQNFLTSSDYLTWTVSVPAGADYQATALLKSSATGQQLAISVNGAAPTTFTTNATSFNRYAAGTIHLPAGTDRIVLTRTGTLSGDIAIKSLELLRSSDVTAYNQRVTTARADTTWFSKAGYGLMFQYGSWGYPNNVGVAKSLDQQAADFNVPAFVNMVKQSGASYVVWSTSWWGYHMDAPLTSPNTIVTAAGGPANPGLTSSRDLIGEISSALHAQGIRFMLYYHTGDEDKAWWPYQNFPTSFSATGTGDRTTFLNNWKQVVTEIGNRYGTNLDGYFFDDGVIYYPAPFESLEQAARSGNPNRLISWSGSPIGGTRLTDFQDVWFGEGSQGQTTTGSAPAGGNGIFTTGPNQGLLQQGMFIMDQDWGVHVQDQKITASSAITSHSLISNVTSAIARRVPVSIDLMMYEDGTVADADLAKLNDLRQAVHGTTETVPTGTSVVNDSSSALTYTGAWTHATGRGAGDYGDDVHWASTNGDSVSYAFTGTGVDVLGPKSSVSGHFDAYIDNTLIGTFSENAVSYTPQAVIYSARHLAPGTHTVKLVKDDSTYFQIDAVRPIANPVTLNDDNSALTYTGSWTHKTGRGAGDYNDDVHTTSVNGDTVTLTFTGTGIDVLGPMEPIDGTASVTLDGTQVSTIQATYSGAYTPQQHYWGIRDLAPGTHTLTLTKTGGSYLQIDALTVWP